MIPGAPRCWSSTTRRGARSISTCVDPLPEVLARALPPETTDWTGAAQKLGVMSREISLLPGTGLGSNASPTTAAVAAIRPPGGPGAHVGTREINAPAKPMSQPAGSPLRYGGQLSQLRRGHPRPICSRPRPLGPDDPPSAARHPCPRLSSFSPEQRFTRLPRCAPNIVIAAEPVLGIVPGLDFAEPPEIPPITWATHRPGPGCSRTPSRRARVAWRGRNFRVYSDLRASAASAQVARTRSKPSDPRASNAVASGAPGWPRRERAPERKRSGRGAGFGHPHETHPRRRPATRARSCSSSS